MSRQCMAVVLQRLCQLHQLSGQLFQLFLSLHQTCMVEDSSLGCGFMSTDTDHQGDGFHHESLAARAALPSPSLSSDLHDDRAQEPRPLKMQTGASAHQPRLRDIELPLKGSGTAMPCVNGRQLSEQLFRGFPSPHRTCIVEDVGW